jgi:glycosyltransferase involved in cell wall biosynthesis
MMLITYNHAKFIAQAIESVLAQETEYSYEINVIEDCSTDGTQDVVMRYVRSHPHIVKPFFNKKNIGFKVTQKNFFRGFKTLKGQYIAFLEGDDYWTSVDKLQRQVAFLEANPEFAACAHNTTVVYEDARKAPHRFMDWAKPQVSTIEDMISLVSFWHNTGMLYRNVFHGVPPRHFRSRWSGDIFLGIAHAQFGKVYFMEDDMSVYRIHPGGVFSSMPVVDGWFFNLGMLQRYNRWLRYKYAKAFAGSIVRYCGGVLRDEGRGDVPALTPFQRLRIRWMRRRYQWLYDLAR